MVTMMLVYVELVRLDWVCLSVVRLIPGGIFALLRYGMSGVRHGV